MLEPFLRQYVTCGPSIIMRASSARGYLANFVKKVATETSLEGIGDFLWLSGTATLLKIRNRYCIVLTRHEINIRDQGIPDIDVLNTVRVLTELDGTMSNILFNRIHFCQDDAEEEYQDIIILEACEASITKHGLAGHFMPVVEFDMDDVIYSCVVATERGNEEIENGQANNVHVRAISKSCEFDASYTSNARFLKRFIYTPEVDFPEDGWSGGAVFSMMPYGLSNRFVCSGIVTRAKNGFVHVISVDYLLDFARSYL